MLTETTVNPLELEDAEAAARLLTNVFIRDEPMTRVLGATEEMYLPFARLFCEQIARDGLSFVAHHHNELVGFVICKDFCSNPAAGFADRFPQLVHLTAANMAFLEALDEPWSSTHAPQPGQCLHLLYGGVVPAFRGQHILDPVLAQTLEHAMSLGFTRALSECTSQASMKVLHRHGFQQAHALAYASFTHDGGHPLRQLEGSCFLMVRDPLQQG